MSIFPGPQPGASAGAGGLSLVSEHVLSAPGTLIQVTGLNLDVQKIYKIVYSCNFTGSPTSNQVFWTFNDDNAQTNYFKERHNGSSTLGTSNDSTIENAILNSGNIRAGVGDLIIAVNSAATSEYPILSYTTMGSSLGNAAIVYKDLTTNVTKLAIRSSSMNFGIGSYLRVYK